MFERLQSRFWSEVENIGGGYCRPTGCARRDFTDAELASYAEGVANVIVCLFESLQTNATEDFRGSGTDAGRWIDQIRGAVGEQLRRRHPGERACAGRKFNTWLTAIRDKRIAMIDECWSDAWPFHRQMRKEIEQWGRRQTEQLDEESYWLLERIKDELQALHDLYDHLGCDREWQKKKFDLGMKAKEGKVATCA